MHVQVGRSQLGTPLVQKILKSSLTLVHDFCRLHRNIDSLYAGKQQLSALTSHPGTLGSVDVISPSKNDSDKGYILLMWSIITDIFILEVHSLYLKRIQRSLETSREFANQWRRNRLESPKDDMMNRPQEVLLMLLDEVYGMWEAVERERFHIPDWMMQQGESKSTIINRRFVVDTAENMMYALDKGLRRAEREIQRIRQNADITFIRIGSLTREEAESQGLVWLGD